MSAGLFATARRGPLSLEEIREIEAHRNRDRPTPWQALAARYARPVADIRAVLEAPRPSGEPVPRPIAANDSEPVKPLSDRLTRHERRFREMWESGVGVRDICLALGLGQTSVGILRTRLGLPGRRVGNPGHQWTPSADALIRREYIIAGKSSGAVAAMLGCSRGALVGRVHRLGLAKHLPVTQAIRQSS